MTINENISFIDNLSGIRLPDCSKLAINPKSESDVIIFRHDLSVKVFWWSFVSLVKFRYCFRFHVNIITGSGVMTIFFYKGLTGNLEIRNTSVWVLPNIWGQGQVRITSLTRVTAFTVSESLKENQQGEGIKLSPPPPSYPD